jgi:FO synthase
MLRTIATARLILGGGMNIQAPPNLTPDGYELYLEAGINDWGGVSPLTPDFINPEAPWPALTLLRQKSAQAGFELKARLPVYPDIIAQGENFLSEPMLALVKRQSDSNGFVKHGGPLRFMPAVQNSSAPNLSRLSC